MGSSFLVTIHRKDQTLTREVTADSFSVGRSVECDLPLSDSQISRVHLTVSRHGNELYIEDKNSSNGTFVNEERITAGVAVAVNPTDRIQLGRSEYSLYLELKVEPQVVAEPEPEEEPELEPTMAMVAPTLPPQQADKILQEAKRQAAQIVLEGETQAEKRVQAIYQKAREDQAKAEQHYNTRVNEANKEADQILEDAKKQGQSLLHEARRMSQELREEVDHYVQSLREKGKKEAEALHSEATAQADKVRAEAFAQSRLEAKEEAENIVKTAKEEAERLIEFTKMQAADIEVQNKTNSEELKKVTEELTSQSAELEKVSEELKATSEKARQLSEQITVDEERIAKALADEKDRVETLLKEERETLDSYLKEKEETSQKIIQEQEQKVAEAIATEESRVAQAIQEEETRVAEAIAKEEARVAEIIAHEETRVAEILKREEERVAEILEQERLKVGDLKQQESDLLKSKSNLETEISGLQSRQGKVVADLNDLENRFALLAKDYEAEKVKYADKIANEFATQKKNAEDKRNTFELELNRRLQELEKKMLDEVLGKKDDLVKNLHAAIEKQLINAVDPERWPFVSNNLGMIINEAFEGKVATLAQETSSIQSLDKLVAQKRNEKYRMLVFGMACGLALFFCGQLIYQRISADQNPLQTMTQQAAQKRQEDLEARKFNPPQTDEVRDTYTDSVIYTRNFVDIYTEPAFQEKLYKAASQYLLKTWRVDEDKSIQVLAASSALVKDLADRRSKIHPDYVKEGIDKMRASEKELLARLRSILGTDVRVESFRRFERNFYAEELKNRRMAGQR